MAHRLIYKCDTAHIFSSFIIAPVYLSPVYFPHYMLCHCIFSLTWMPEGQSKNALCSTLGRALQGFYSVAHPTTGEFKTW